MKDLCRRFFYEETAVGVVEMILIRSLYGGIVNRASLILSLKAMILQARELFSLRHPAAVVLARQTRV